MVTAELDEVGVETVDLPGADLDQFTAVSDQQSQVFCDPLGAGRGKVFFPGGYSSDQQRVGGVVLHRCALSLPFGGGHLWWYVHYLETCLQERQSRRASVVAGSLDPYPPGSGVPCPGHQPGMTPGVLETQRVPTGRWA